MKTWEQTRDTISTVRLLEWKKVGGRRWTGGWTSASWNAGLGGELDGGCGGDGY